jgi:glycosyltransferase involved in cell wall biosynthesis
LNGLIPVTESNSGPPVDFRESAFVVVPAYNEATGIERVLRELVAVYPNVVLVDDGSNDDTAAIARQCVPYVVRHPINRGQGAALQTGIEFSLRHGAGYVVSFDADGQHRVEDIAALLAPLAAGQCEVTLGSRFLGTAEGIPSGRRLLLKIVAWWTRHVSRMDLTDAHNGLRAFTRRAAETMEISMDRMAHASEIVDCIRRTRLPYREVPVSIRYTAYSLAKGQRLRDAFRVLTDYLVGRMIRW